MLNNYKFPKDFSDRVTLLLSEPGDFGQGYNYATDFEAHLRGINEILDNLRSNNGKVERKYLSSEAKRAANQYGINLDSVDPKSLSGIINQRIQPQVDQLRSTYSIQSQVQKKKAESELDAMNRAELDRLPFSKKVAYKMAGRLGLDYDHKSDDAGKFIAEHAGDYIRERGKDVGGTIRSIKENAPKVFDDITGFKGSKLSQELRSQRENYINKAREPLEQEIRDKVSSTTDKYFDRVKRKKGIELSDKNKSRYTESVERNVKDDSNYNEKRDNIIKTAGEQFDKDNARKIQKAKDRDSTLRARRIMGGIQNVGTAIDSGLDMVSSKHRAQTLATQGHAGIARKQARMAQLFGDKSLTTKFVAGNWGSGFRNWGEGMGVPGLIGNLFSKGVDRLNPVSNKIRSNEAAYEKSARYFSEQENLSWQPEEYARLKLILEREYENPEDFSEQGNSETQQPYDGQGFYDASQEVDISSLTPEKAEQILNRTYYTVAEDEKKYQESIAKGFSEDQRKRKSYENFLNECSEIYDISAWR